MCLPPLRLDLDMDKEEIYVSTRERIMEQINVMPDEEVIDMFRMWESAMRGAQGYARKAQEPAPGEILKEYRKGIHVEEDFDYKAELARYRDEKYADPG